MGISCQDEMTIRRDHRVGGAFWRHGAGLARGCIDQVGSQWLSRLSAGIGELGAVARPRAENPNVYDRSEVEMAWFTRSVYNGYPYDSKFEAQYAMELDWRVRASEIKAWDRQFPIEIRNPKTGKLLRRHKVDFRVHENDGSFTLVET